MVPNWCKVYANEFVNVDLKWHFPEIESSHAWGDNGTVYEHFGVDFPLKNLRLYGDGEMSSACIDVDGHITGQADTYMVPYQLEPFFNAPTCENNDNIKGRVCPVGDVTLGVIRMKTEISYKDLKTNIPLDGKPDKPDKPDKPPGSLVDAQRFMLTRTYSGAQNGDPWTILSGSDYDAHYKDKNEAETVQGGDGNKDKNKGDKDKANYIGFASVNAEVNQTLLFEPATFNETPFSKLTLDLMNTPKDGWMRTVFQTLLRM